jgi:hypothetical protein
VAFILLFFFPFNDISFKITKVAYLIQMDLSPKLKDTIKNRKDPNNKGTNQNKTLANNKAKSETTTPATRRCRQTRHHTSRKNLL